MSDVWRASDIFVFNGDIARTKEVIEYFFYRVFIRCNYYPFLEHKKQIRKSMKMSFISDNIRDIRCVRHMVS